MKHRSFDDDAIPLEIRLDNAVREYERERETYYAEHEAEEYRKAIDVIAQGIHRAAFELTEPVPFFDLDVPWDVTLPPKVGQRSIGGSQPG